MEGISPARFLVAVATGSALVALLLFGGMRAAAQAADSPPMTVMLELEAPPAAEAYAAGQAAKRSPAAACAEVRERLAEIEAGQQQLLSALAAKSLSVKTMFRAQRVYNGVAVRAAAGQLEALRALPGVKAVHVIRPVHLDNTTSVPFLGAPAIWQNPGLTGEGITIGILDTGIDYLHPDFGGSGDPGDYARNDPRVIGDVPFPTAKIAGGYDFVGDAYDPEDAEHDMPVPDPDPFDQQGHGTHVAGTAAGGGITALAAAYSGPYDTSVPFDTMLVGPGVAPMASLYALKVFGPALQSTVIVPAIEWAVDPNGDGDFSDHLDVLNLSIGDDLSPGDTPEGIACGNAVAAGVIVVAAAGNRRDSYFVTGSPASAPAVISVAGSEDEDPAYPALSPDRIASFSSRGPGSLNNGALVLKPDIAAPGQQIRSANLRASASSLLVGVRQGTSMATPHVSGVMALLRQRLPDWSVPELKALAMNTATFDLFYNAGYTPPPQSPSRAGAGRVNPVWAMENRLLAFNAAHPEEVSITFETTEVLDSAHETQTLRILNKGSQTEERRLSLDLRATIPGVTVSLGAAATGPLAPGQYVDIPIHLEAVAAAMKHTRDPGAIETFGGVYRAWVSEVSGYVVLTPVTQGDIVRAPFYGALRPVSDMRSAESTLDASQTSSVEIALTGTGLNTGDSYPTDIVSLLSPFELLAYSPDEGASDGLANAADIKYVGVRSDYPDCVANGQGIEAATLYFGIATHRPWFSPYWTMFIIYFDSNRDGNPDYAVYNVPEYDFSMNDIFTVRFSDFQSVDAVITDLNGYTAGQYDTAPFMSNVIVFPVPAQALQLDANNPRFYFWVKTYLFPELAIDSKKRLIDQTSLIAYDAMHPGLAFPDAENRSPMRFDLDNTALPATLDAAAYHANGVLVPVLGQYRAAGSIGALLFHHHNANGLKDEWLPLLTSGDSDADNIPDTEEGAGDDDHDGIPNYLDTDSDDDGILDLMETNADTDGDGTPNYLDPDSDDDGLSDKEEDSEYHTNPYLADSDQDGIPDMTDGLVDADHDGKINALDDDSDADGIPDAVEGLGDPDLDSTPNYLDPDSDGDGLLDAQEGIADPDHDTTPNYLDLDSDDDTLSDETETEIGTNPYLADTDQDGQPDNVDAAPLVPQAPGAPQNVQASDGAYADKVNITWDALPGAAEYRVYRGENGDVASAIPLNQAWQTAASFEDATAQPPTPPPFGCFGDPQPVIYTYWVQARIAPAGGTPTEPGAFSAPDAGYRGVSAKK